MSKGGYRYTFVDPVFDLDDIYDYSLDSGLQNAPFTNWLVTGNTCLIEFGYMTKETLAGVPSANLNLVDPTGTNLNIGMQSSDLTLEGVVHTVTVLAISPSYQCAQKDFLVRPYWVCPDDTF